MPDSPPPSSAVEHLARALQALDLTADPEAARTPERVAELLQSFAPAREPLSLSTTAVVHPVPVVVREIPFHSLCVHHLLPFFGQVSVAYRPDAVLLGLGSIPRVVRHHSRQLQLQERLAEQIADTIRAHTQAPAVAVGIRARHMCVEMRGAASPCEVRVVAQRGTPDDWLLRQVE